MATSETKLRFLLSPSVIEAELRRRRAATQYLMRETIAENSRTQFSRQVKTLELPLAPPTMQLN